jgi:alkyl hydroperoxide reductase subunit AhpC
MGCASCGKNKRTQGYSEPNALLNPPYNANDMYILENSSVRRFSNTDWRENTHKLLLFFPEIFTPVCTTEMGALPKWIEFFKEQQTDVFAVTTDHISGVQEWYHTEPALKDANYPVISSYILTSRLNLVHQGRAKRASVFISKDGEVITHEYPLRVGRSLAELHRMIYAYNTGSFCGEGWKDVSDGFLENIKET